MPSIETTRTLLTWTAPALAIPTLRYTQDDRDQRKTLFIRDLSTYTIGAALFLVSEIAFRKLFQGQKLAPKTTELGAFILALTLNILYAGMGAVQLSHWFNRHYGDPAQSATDPDKKAEPKPTPPAASGHSNPPKSPSGPVNLSSTPSPYIPPATPYGNNSFWNVGPNALNPSGFSNPNQYGPYGYGVTGMPPAPIPTPFAPMPPMPRSYIA
jgi:hypothetical protein